MVRTNDILTGILLISGAFLLSRKNGGSYSLQNLPITEQIYQKRKAINTEAILDIQNIQDRLENIRSQTLQQEKFKTEAQQGLLETEKGKAGVLISQLQKIVQLGYGHETYSPRVRAKVISKRGYDPVNYAAIERGKQAKEIIPQITNIVKKLDENILSLRKRYSSLEAI